ncbi:helix-turn-helix domain-containing protein [Microbispora sp. RL4-1S]|uniref:Helix-turn-helix domain-containing protein n=1 Tax=Microbispora oryzae TaxID=2806554 RepID=A0A940WBT6_9ACTN|nr:helix-turn-helix domain-containing protein [Microbispora oryzae]MBP2702589.1 helix-turn-helix domain-containing protein [Microbispora oryzae]
MDLEGADRAEAAHGEAGRDGGHGDGAVRDDVAGGHHLGALTVARIARFAGLSPRTLVRRFHEATGTTPLRWLHVQRLARARELLESTDLPIEHIGRLCGMGSAGNLRHHFTRSAGVTPMAYRRSFQGDRPPGGPGRPVAGGAG